MWPQSAQHSLRFRNALTLLEAGGYDVDVRQDELVLRASRTGRAWVCRTAEDFDSACSFYAWEAMGQRSQPASALIWTDAIPHDPAMQRALKAFYEKGYAIRIARGSIGYVDRLGRNWTFLSRDEFIAGVARLGRAPASSAGMGGGAVRPSPTQRPDGQLAPTAPVQPAWAGGEMASLAALEQRLVSMEARAVAAERRAAELATLLTRFDRARGTGHALGLLHRGYAKVAGLMNRRLSRAMPRQIGM